MSFTHAHYDEQDQNRVKRLCLEYEPVAAGLTSGALNTPVTNWPAAPCSAAYLRFNAGALQWHDPRTGEQAWADVRAEREKRYVLGDRVALKAFSQGVPMPPAWAAHQQALRDITTQSDPFNITWPTPPSE